MQFSGIRLIGRGYNSKAHDLAECRWLVSQDIGGGVIYDLTLLVAELSTSTEARGTPLSARPRKVASANST